MFCKKCGSELEEGQALCPTCGYQDDGIGKNTKIIISVVCILLLAAVLAVVIIMSVKGKKPDTGDKTTVTVTENVTTEDVTEETTPPAANYTSYTVSADVIQENRDTVVAEVGEYQLTVAQLQLHYWFQIAQYYNNNMQYIYYGQIALDPTAPLDTQPCTENPTISWQEYFIQKGISAWRSYVLLNLMADRDGYEMAADTMDSMKLDMLESAQAAGFETVEEFVLDMLKSSVGAGSTVDDYWEYMKLINRANAYYMYWYERETPSDDELEAYYLKNEQQLKDNGVGKDAGNLVDVRHILVMVENEDWATAEKEANEILQKWKTGGATEEVFAELANKYSEDGGSNTVGGLYSGVQPGQMVEVFNNWIMDDSRQYGDTAVLKADYHYQGYHVMYFVSGKPIWKEAALQSIMSQRSTDMATKAKEMGQFQQFDENIMLGEPVTE